MASLYDELPWSFFVTLTPRQGDPDDALWTYLSSWWVPDWKSGDPDYPETQPFWIMTLSNHNVSWKPGSLNPFKVGNPHAHLLLGNIEMDALYFALSSWPGVFDIAKDRRGVARIWNRWGILHYVHSQEKSPFRHAQDKGSYCSALLEAPRHSPNLARYEREVYRRRLERLKTITNTDRWLAGLPYESPVSVTDARRVTESK